MSQDDSTKAAVRSGRAEVSVAIADLIVNVAGLALKLDRVVAIAKIAEAGRVATVMPFAQGAEVANLMDQDADCVAEPGEARAINLAESVSFPLSPLQNSQAGDSDKSKRHLACSSDSKVVEAASESKGAGYIEENSIAARVLELHDRLGGFIESSPPQSSHQKTKPTD